MNAQHRQIIEDNRSILQENISLLSYLDIKRYLQECKMFNQYMWDDIHSLSDILDILPTRGPEAFNNFIEILRKSNCNKEADILEKPTLCMDVTDMYYKMSSTPLGYCLIINNVEFENPQKNRPSSDIDANAFLSFFKGIGFNVAVKRNKKAGAMYECIKNFSNKDFRNVDCMVLIVLSHGNKKNNREYLCGTDMEYVFKDDICNMFSNCRSLVRKPKIFFFVACRGDTSDYGTVNISAKESADTDGTPNNEVVPSRSDMFIISSTLPDLVSILDHEKGSNFCAALMPILIEKHKTDDLETIMMFVNRKLQEKVSEVFRIAQASNTDSRGCTKKVMLCHRL